MACLIKHYLLLYKFEYQLYIKYFIQYPHYFTTMYCMVLNIIHIFVLSCYWVMYSSKYFKAP